MRLFLRALRWEHPELRPGVPEGLLGRYLKEEDEATHYEDAHTGEGRRRLSVCARDLYRLVDRFHGTTAAQLEEYRLLLEQCHVGKHRDGRPRDDDDDAGECKVPVALKDPKQVSADSLQSPHDPDVTYSGHKGKGYEVQVAETCHEENATQLITHVEVTPSSGSDTDVSVPVVDGLAERKVRPDELFADTAYGSGRNAFEASRRGTELVSVKGGEKVYHCGGGIVYHRHDEKGLNWEPGGIRSGAGVRSSGVSQESTGSSDTWEAALCRLCLRR